MPLSRKRSILYLSGIGVLLVFAYCLRSVFHFMTEDALLGISMMTLRWVIHIALTIGWCILINRRILSRSIKTLLLSVGGLLIFWQLVRIIKYDYVIVTGPIGRYCWYSYYIPMTLVPLLGVFIIAHIGKPENYHSPAWLKLLFIPAFALIATVMTNDVHQLVFTFHDGFELYNSSYGYDFMYIIVMAWFVLMGLYFVIMLLYKSRVPGNKSFQKLPLIIMLGAVFFWAGYSMKLYTGDLTAIDCIIIILLLESAIQSGLISSNMNYNELLRQSTIAVQIVDGQKNVHYSASSAVPLEASVVEQAIIAPVDLGDTVLHSQPISGGYVLWQDDVRELSELALHLREANDLLSQRNDLVKAEIELHQRKLQEEEKTRLYDRVAKEIALQLDKADEILRMSRADSEQSNVLLAQICVISAYIKRRANLILMSEEQEFTSGEELISCLRESLDNLQLCNAITYLDKHCDGQIAISNIIAIYDFFENVTEHLLSQLNAMMVTVKSRDGGIQLQMQIGCHEAMPELPELKLAGGTVHCVVQEEDIIIKAHLPGGDSTC